MTTDVRAVATPPRVSEAEAVHLIEHGEQHASRAEYAEAEACFRSAILSDQARHDDSTDPAALARGARALLNLGRLRGMFCDFREATTFLERSIALTDEARRRGANPGETALARGRALLALGRLEGARASGGAARERYALAVSAYEEAIAGARAAVPSQLADIHLALGRLHAGLLHAQTAESHYRISADLSESALPSNIRDGSASVLLGKALSGLGRLHASQHRYEHARTSFVHAILAFDTAIRAEPDSLDARTNRGNALLFRGDMEQSSGHDDEARNCFAEAAATYEDVAGLAPHHVIARANLALTLTRMAAIAGASSGDEASAEMLRRAVDTATQVLALAPDCVSARNTKGSALVSLGRWHTQRSENRDAVDAFEAAAEEFARSLEIAAADARTRSFYDQLKGALEPL